MTHTIPSAEACAGEPVRFPPLVVVDPAHEAAAVTDAYRNQVISQVNTSCLRLAVLSGDYPWHQHPRPDELFLVMEGKFEIELADGRVLRLRPCKRCGCVTHYKYRKKGRWYPIAVNARNFEPDALRGVRVRKLDGAATWTWKYET